MTHKKLFNCSVFIGKQSFTKTGREVLTAIKGHDEINDKLTTDYQCSYQNGSRMPRIGFTTGGLLIKGKSSSMDAIYLLI